VPADKAATVFLIAFELGDEKSGLLAASSTRCGGLINTTLAERI
jgi:hypothetical protein